MSGRNNLPKSDWHSIKYNRNQHGVPSFEADLSCVNYKPSLSNEEGKQQQQQQQQQQQPYPTRWGRLHGSYDAIRPCQQPTLQEYYSPKGSILQEGKQCYKNSNLKSPEVLSMGRFISTIGHIWDSASQSLSCVDYKEIVNQDDKGFQKEKVLINFGDKINGRAYSSNATNNSAVRVRDTSLVSSSKLANIHFPKVTQKIVVLESCNGSQDYVRSLFNKILLRSLNISHESWKPKDILTEEISFKLGNRYWCMSRSASKGLKYPVEVAEPENMKTASLGVVSCTSIDASTPTFANKSDECNPAMTISDDLLSSSDGMLDGRKVTSLSADYCPRIIHDTVADVGVSQVLSPSMCSDYHIDSLVKCDSASVGCQLVIDDNKLLKPKQGHLSDTITDEESKVEVLSKEKPYYSLAKQEHAFSGALAGLCVSLCLHPVDTIKTVIQSCHAEKKSIFHIGKSIVSDRGLPGLYRGITTSIASSAPISAVYTFTYESVKAALLPYLPKEYFSFAHCVAGGCASIATSSIFTPSERIKQQMQVGSHYRNCWFALDEIIRKGGFHSLYAGWGAVLCRNVPHSIVKFYMYEKLKQVMSSFPSSVKPNTFQTLLCGGLAGSTAAFVTTPFDVIKTRLQTQIPGSVNQYHSVFHALCKIGKNEGVRGLYRGLTPRLIIYMFQGSLFFASYEFFKRLFSLEA